MRKINKILIGRVLLFSLSTLISLVLLELGVRRLYISKRPEITKEDFYIYDTSAKYNHHKRQFTKNDGKKRSSNDYYYSTYNFGENGINVLIQGDSWMELYDEFGELDSNLKYSKNCSLLINGGTSSYSPSLIEVQFNDIIEDQDIKFDLIICYLDQTDFMDEVLRYNHLRLESNNKLIAVLKDNNLTGPTMYSNYNYNYSYVNRYASPIKTISIIENALQSKYFLPYRRTYLDIEEVTWDKISSFMRGDVNNSDIIIFQKNLNSLLSAYTKDDAKVVFFTHRHRKHFERVYKNDIYHIAKKVISKFDNVEIRDITKIHNKINISNLDDYFPKWDKDPASHPHMNYWKNEVSPIILNVIEKIN